MAGHTSSSIGTMIQAGGCGHGALTSEQALEKARAFADAERDKDTR
jgi:hypothetical protein